MPDIYTLATCCGKQTANANLHWTAKPQTTYSVGGSVTTLGKLWPSAWAAGCRWGAATEGALAFAGGLLTGTFAPFADLCADSGSAFGSRTGATNRG